MTEAELALKFIDYFAEFDIYKEVPGGGGIIDIVAVKTGIRTALEAKIHLSFDVMHQAYQAKHQCHYAYAAVPVKSWRLHPAQEALCRHWGIGVIGCMELKYSHNNYNPKLHAHKVEGKYEIKEIIAPVFNRHARKIFLHDYMKRSQAGSQSSRMTAFGYFVECFTTIVARHPQGIGFKECFDELSFKHYRNVSLFKNAAAKYCNQGVIKNIDFVAGKFHYKKD
jgi:hypothetical protein